MIDQVKQDNKRLQHLRRRLHLVILAWLMFCIPLLGDAPLIAIPAYLFLLVNGVGFFFTLKEHWYASAILAVWTSCVPLLCFSILDINYWMQSEIALLATLALMSVITLYLINRSWQDRFKLHRDWQCQTCGYNVLNLTSNTCPECGEFFDTQLAIASKEAHEQMRKIKLIGE